MCKGDDDVFIDFDIYMKKGCRSCFLLCFCIGRYSFPK